MGCSLDPQLGLKSDGVFLAPHLAVAKGFIKMFPTFFVVVVNNAIMLKHLFSAALIRLVDSLSRIGHLDWPSPLSEL